MAVPSDMDRCIPLSSDIQTLYHFGIFLYKEPL